MSDTVDLVRFKTSQVRHLEVGTGGRLVTACGQNAHHQEHYTGKPSDVTCELCRQHYSLREKSHV